MNFVDTYQEEFVDRGMDRMELFRALNQSFHINKALYLGSHIHITPSFVFPDVTYVDSYKRAAKLFKETSEITEYIDKNKDYSEPSKFQFIDSDYTQPIGLIGDFDLLISQYAGFVSQAGKKYLKKGGTLVVNDSHGDASMAKLDTDYELIAVVNHINAKWVVSEENLDDYFVRKDGKTNSISELERIGKEPSYRKTATNYIFKYKS